MHQHSKLALTQSYRRIRYTSGQDLILRRRLPSNPLRLDLRMQIGYVCHIPAVQHNQTHLAQSLDYLWAVVFTVAPAQVTLTSGSTSRCFDVPGGVTKLKLLCSPGAQSANLSRNQPNFKSIQLQPIGFNFITEPETYNFNAYVATASS